MSRPLNRQQAAVRSWALLLLGSGVLLLCAIGFQVWRAWSVDHRWPRVPGELLEVEVETYESWRPMGRRIDLHRAKVFYAYFVDGVEYEGRTLSAFFLPGVDLPAHQDALAKGLRRGQTVEVCVAPTDPACCYLGGGTDLGLALAWGGFALVLVLAGSALIPLVRLVGAKRGRALSWWFRGSGFALGIGVGQLGFRTLSMGGGSSTLWIGSILTLGFLALLLKPILAPEESPVARAQS